MLTSVYYLGSRDKLASHICDAFFMTEMINNGTNVLNGRCLFVGIVDALLILTYVIGVIQCAMYMLTNA